jgi:hypothetical protein
MPRLDGQLRILPVRDRLPTRGQSFIQRRLHQIFVDRLRRNAVHARSERLVGHKMICRMRNVNRDGLTGGRKSETKTRGQKGKNSGWLSQAGRPPNHQLKRLNTGVYEKNAFTANF